MGSFRLIFIMLTGIATLGCGSQRPYVLPRPPRAEAAATVTPNTTLERALLNQLDGLVLGQALKNSEGTASVERTYTAANGRRCRTVHLNFNGQAAIQRLACRDNQRWFFVPTLNANDPQSMSQHQAQVAASSEVSR